MEEQETNFRLRNILVLLAVAVMFFSEANFFSGLKFHTTDISESAGYQKLEQLEKAKSKKTTISTKELDKSRNKLAEKSKKATLNKAKIATVKSLNNTKLTSTKSSSRVLNLIGVRTSYHNCNNDMSTPNSGAYYCNFRGSQSTFIYGHNRAGIFAALRTLRPGDQVKVQIGGHVKTYKVVNSFRLTKASTSGASNSNLRVVLYTSNYGGAFGNTPASRRITFQTCEGANDVYRRYIQAIEL